MFFGLFLVFFFFLPLLPHHNLEAEGYGSSNWVVVEGDTRPTHTGAGQGK